MNFEDFSTKPGPCLLSTLLFESLRPRGLRTFALVAALVSVPELQSFVDARGRSAGHGGPEQTWKTKTSVIWIT